MVITEISENEKKILTLFTQHDTLNKQQILETGLMSWATITKLVNKMTKDGTLEVAGTSDRKVQKGKNSYIYRLSDYTHQAVGIDIEYKQTKIILLSISGKILFRKEYATPQEPNLSELQHFLETVINDFFAECPCSLKTLKGIGIGIPGISIPAWLTDTVSENILKQNELKDFLQHRFNLPVRIENNVRAYAMFERWNKVSFSMNDFIFISIRTGVGSGIVINNTIYSGQQALAGEIGHFTVKEGGKLCRCGKRGCLETEFNQHKLYKLYIQEIFGKDPGDYDIQDLKDGLADLFSRAKKGETLAMSILQNEFAILAGPLANLIMILNIRDVIISGYFGVDGDVMIPILQKEVKKRLLPKMKFSITYYPYDSEGFIRGAALLVLIEFLSVI